LVVDVAQLAHAIVVQQWHPAVAVFQHELRVALHIVNIDFKLN